MGTLIDTSIFIAADRGQLDLPGILRVQGGETVALASVTASELLHGVHRALNPNDRQRREAFVEAILSQLPVMPFDLVAARVHARVWAELAQKGTPVGLHDLLIGATALSIGYRVATRDEQSFSRIPGLSVVRW